MATIIPMQDEVGPKKRGRKPKVTSNITTLSPSKRRGKLNIVTVAPPSEQLLEEEEKMESSLPIEKPVRADLVLVTEKSALLTEQSSSKILDFELDAIIKPLQVDAVEDNADQYLVRLYVDPPEVENLPEGKEEDVDFFESGKSYFEVLRKFCKGYPEKTDVLCWWCSHGFSNHPIGIPVRYNADSGVYKVFGCFCTFSCALAFLIDEKNKFSIIRNVTPMEITQFYRTVTGDESVGLKNMIKPAPKKYCLKAFGGSMSIEEFRMAASINMHFSTVLSPMIPWNMYMEEVNNVSKCFIGKDGVKRPLKIRMASKKSEETPTSSIAVPRIKQIVKRGDRNQITVSVGASM
jgi:hypothetical protein